MLTGVLGTLKSSYLTDFPQCEVSPGSLWCQDAEVDEGTAQGDVKIDWEELALHKSERVPWEAPKKQEAWEVEGHKHPLGHFRIPLPLRPHPK